MRVAQFVISSNQIESNLFAMSSVHNITIHEFIFGVLLYS